MKSLLFLAFLYFIQGLPYGLQSRFLPIYFRTHGMSLTDISMFKLLLIPWMCKALWAPFVDTYGTKKLWLTWSMVGLIFTCFLGSFTSPDHIVELGVVMFLFNLITSTQDIAVDGIAIQVLTSSELAYGNIAQVVGYKFGAIFGGGVLSWLSDYVEWTVLFICLALVYVFSLIFVQIFVHPPQQLKSEMDEGEKEHGSMERKLLPGIKSTFQQIYNTPGTLWIMMFVIIYKLGEQGALNMVPLFLIDKKIPASWVGFWTGMVGQGVSIFGSVLGGWAISHLGYTTAKTLKLTCILRVIPLSLQLLVVWTWSEDISSFSSLLSVFAMSAMLFISGTVTTATFTLMMQCSQRAPPTVQSTHYTVLATLEVMGKLTFSVMIGPLTELLGYNFIFVLFIILTSIVLLMFQKFPYLSISETIVTNKNS
ncbi:major facilitator superfamily domain-containing protein 3-like [Mytilus californianus]|uniref:major facilitator superfamily domain-containing protein 3-like n=1 Tax=Mytilus californianus TaxID=6549 RepID=UPI002248578B|nr:major facilitator superfamily domain-containing protein 3-like [Mytilus californianus]